MKKTRAAPKKKKNISANHKTAFFPIVGIGASAGGLEAYQEILRNLSAKPGMAFVFVMHLAPGHKSMLTELLARLTKMPVREIKSSMPIEVNHVYVIPPGTNVSIANGKLKLNKMRDAGLKRMPIDWFFRSLAEEHGNRAIGVILSGTATDGTLGAEAIKAEGGIIFAQDEKSAKYDGMPRSAIGAGCVDFVLSPKKIARELERIAKHPLISSAGLVKADKSIVTKDKGLGSIFDILRLSHRLDFAHYKTTTISRRISRRMVLLKLENLKNYIKFLRENKDEVENLYEDLLLKVTSFFRDPKVFHILKKRIIPAILKNKTKGQEVRIWVPGCSSGEEAYSIAICLIEAMGNKRGMVPVRIFATDVSESSVNKARHGIYGKTIQNDVAPERLKRFFTKTGDSYKVSKLLREMCIFSKQNVFGDPPFSNVDLISCRNLLIYFQPVLQKEVFHKFHYALKPGGFLVLGSSESAGGYSNLFKTLDRKQRIFVKKYLSAEPKLGLGQKYYLPNKLEIKEKTGVRKGKETDTESLVERVVLSEYAPCGVLIDSDMEVVQFHGHTGRYLESAAGKPSHNLFKLAPKGLFQPLHTAIYKARRTKHTVKIEAQDVKYDGRRMRVNITVIPVKSGPLKEEFFLVLFDEITRAVRSKNLPKARGKSVKDEKYVESLQRELAETKEYLQSIIEEQENANEEVKTANEEILSSNEELLSTNEELETAKEELQSSNEELVTTNEELQNRNKEVVLLNNDLINLLGSTNMPIIMMGTDLVIRRVTVQAEKALNVISSDIGRPISKVKLNVDIPDFEKILLDVIETLRSKTFEIKDKEENWYSVYIRPYRTLDNKIKGVVAIFVDITESKKARQIIEEARAYAETIVETMREPLIVLNTDLKIISANRAFYKTFKIDHKEIQGRSIYDLGNRQWDIPKLRTLLGDILSKNKAIDNYEIEHNFETIGQKTMLFNVRRLATMRMILITIEDITERKQAEKNLHAASLYARSLVEASLDPLVTISQEGKITDVNEAATKATGISREKLIGTDFSDYFTEPKKAREGYQQVFAKGFISDYSLTIRRKDGKLIDVLYNATVYKDDRGNVLGAVAAARDITERKQIERELAQAREKQYRTLIENLPQKVFLKDRNSVYISCNENYARDLNIKPKEIAGKTDHDFFPAYLAEKYIADDKRVMESGKTEDVEEEYLVIKDSIRGAQKAIVNTVKIPVRDKTGKVTGLFGLFWDITKRKEAEEAVRTLNRQIEFVLGATKTGLDIIDSDFNLRYIDPEWQKVYGDPAGKKCYEYFMDRKEMCPDCGVAKALETKKTVVSEEILAKEGNRPIQVTTIPFQDKDGNWLAAEVNVDITERKNMEDSLRAEEGKIRAIFDQSFQFIGTMALDGTLTEVNRTAMQFAGIGESDCLNKPFWETPWWAHSAEMQNKLREAVTKVAGGEVVRFEATYRAADRNVHYIDFSIKPIKDADGKVLFLIAEGRDITEKKRLEEELKLADELKSATEMKSRFTSMVSHELRSPLGAIKEGINLVLEGLVGNINDEQKDLLDTAKRNTDRLGRLINNVLDFQKMESGKMVFNIQENDINEVAQEVNKAMGLLASEKGLDLAVDTDDSIPKIRFDKDKIIQVLTNLVSNAIKYTEKGNIAISTKQEDDTVHVIVQDSGIGIKAEDMERLFCAFEQLDSTRDKKKGGTGLGLAISNEIILAHKGKIWAESEAGKGSAFHFSIPKKLKEKKKLGEILVEEGKISEEDVKKALEKQREEEEGKITENDLRKSLKKQEKQG